MKLLTINLIALFLLTACSSGNGDKPNSGRTSETVTYTHFSTETRGEFISECLQEGSEYYRERLIFQNAYHGSITTEPMQAPECAFPIDRAQRTTKFSYKITQSQNDITYLRLSFQDGPVTAVSIVLTDDGDSLQITFPERTVYYEKLSSTVAGPRQLPPRPTPDLLAFDQLGIGTWITRNCYAGSQANTSMRQIVKFIGEGQASHVAATYESLDCTGEPKLSVNNDFNYTVDRFADGAGQVIMNGEVADIIILNDVLTWNTSSASMVFNRSN